MSDARLVKFCLVALLPGATLSPSLFSARSVSAFSSYFVVRHQEAADTFDPATGVNHELAPVIGADGTTREFDLWTTCYTPRELRLLAERAGLAVDDVFGVQIGKYARTPPNLDCHEHLLLAHRPQ